MGKNVWKRFVSEDICTEKFMNCFTILFIFLLIAPFLLIIEAFLCLYYTSRPSLRSARPPGFTLRTPPLLLKMLIFRYFVPFYCSVHTQWYGKVLRSAKKFKTPKPTLNIVFRLLEHEKHDSKQHWWVFVCRMCFTTITLEGCNRFS